MSYIDRDFISILYDLCAFSKLYDAYNMSKNESGFYDAFVTKDEYDYLKKEATYLCKHEDIDTLKTLRIYSIEFKVLESD